MTADQMTRRNIYLPDDLWEAIQKKAAEEGFKRGTPMHASEWIRDVLQTAVDGGIHRYRDDT